MRHLFRRSSILLALAASRAIAGNVVHDGSLGPNKTLQGPNYTILPGDGRQVGGNLFHSFSKFNLTAGDVADFTGPTSVRNVMARVTDGARSDIDGTLRCSIPAANLFFMNPAGMIFGPNSSIDVDGAFVATSADAIKLADGGRLGGDTIASNSVLTSADPSAFGFLKPNAASIVIAGDAASDARVRLRAGDGKTISFVGGDVSIDAGEVSAPGGRINLFSVRTPGDVVGDVVTPSAAPADVSSIETLGNIHLSSFAQLSVSGDQSGQVVVRGDSMRLDSFASIFATTTDVSGPAIGIDLVLRNRLDVLGGSNIVCGTDGSGNGSVMRAFARVARIESVPDDILTSSLSTSTTGSGTGGDVELHFRRLDIRGTANITSGVQGSGAGGTIIIHAGQVQLDGADAAIQSATLGAGTGTGGSFALHAASLLITRGARIRINSGFSGAVSGSINISLTDSLRMSGANSTIDGDGRLDAQTRGAIVITADQIVLADQSVISGSTLFNAAGGAMTLTARTIDISGGASVRSSTFGGANAGLITIAASDRLTMRDNGSIFTTAFGSGSGGAVLIAAGSISLDTNAGISTSTGGTFQGVTSDGPGGDILITSDSLSLRGGSVISTATLGAGPAGALAIIVSGDITLSGGGSGFNTSTIPFDEAATQGGAGGTLGVFTAATLRIEDGATIRAISATTGDAGAITIDADQLLMRGADADGNPAAISSRSRGAFTGAGRGGTIDITARRIDVADRAIITSASTGPGDSGNITIRATDLSLGSDGLIATSADQANGGVLSINADNAIALVDDARVTAAAAGTGGNISLAAGRDVIVRSSTITAAAGNQGNISIGAGNGIIVSRSTITAQAQNTGGAISLAAKVVTLNNSTINGLAGGNDVLVTINTENLLSSTNSQILTDRGVFTIDTDLAQSLVGFNLNPSSASARLQESCDVRAYGDVSSFTTIGAGGLSLDPAKPAPALSTER